MSTAKWIDTHVHIFPETSKNDELPRLIRLGNAVNTPATYRAGNQNNRPSGVVVVHFSKAADSRHVIDALDEMNSAGCKMPKAGIIKADVNLPETYEWILRDDVKGVRVYAKEGPADFSDKPAWDRLWNLVRSHNKHVLVFGSAPFLCETVQGIPEDLPLVIDHLGLPNAAHGANDASFQVVLDDMVSRNKSAGPVYYKGPGYRTSLDPANVQPFVNEIIRKLGDDRLMLGASDGPFAGPVLEEDARFSGRKLAEIIDFNWVQDYTETLAKNAARDLGRDESELLDRLLFRNAARLYGWS